MSEELILPLDDEIIEEKRDKLRSLLLHLSEQYDDDLDDTINTLSEIYDGGYRQMYSEIFPIIVEIWFNGHPGGLDFLTDNMELVRQHIKEQIQNAPDEPSDDDKKALNRYKQLYGRVLKLSDHISLEVQRLRDYEGIRRESFESVRELSEDVKKAREDLDKAKKKVRKMQTEVIVILGIFAAIVMAMSGGLSLMGSSLEGMSSTGPYKIAFVVLLCGMVVFNTIAFLMISIRKVVGELYDDKEQTVGCQYLKNVAISNGFLIVFNLMMIVMMAIDIYCWARYGGPIV